MKAPAQPHPFNLEQYISQEIEIDGQKKKIVRKDCTLLYSVPFNLCKGILRNIKNGKHLPGTFWKIVKNEVSNTTPLNA
jgi:hypothetical protein